MAKKTTKKIAARKTVPVKKKASLKTLPAKKKSAAKKGLSEKKTVGKFVVKTQDLMDVMQLNIRTAQRLLQKTRAALRKGKNDYVTVREFCTVNKFNEEEFQERLAEV